MVKPIRLFYLKSTHPLWKIYCKSYTEGVRFPNGLVCIWYPWGVHLIPMRCASDTHEVCMWYACGVHVISMRCASDTHEVCMWYPCGVHVISMRCASDTHEVCMWYPCGVHVISMWCACDIQLSNGLLHVISIHPLWKILLQVFHRGSVISKWTAIWSHFLSWYPIALHAHIFQKSHLIPLSAS